ncbi:MAG: hypothetical protein GKR94_34790 [Gammaproteobacteria bacterium]|nr:hypothetical protein [Gammaproteobacteria bacterium]
MREFTHGDESVIDPDLLERAVGISGEKTKKAVVTKALKGACQK